MVLEQWSFAFKTGFCKCIGRKTNQKDIPLHHHHHHDHQQQQQSKITEANYQSSPKHVLTLSLRSLCSIAKSAIANDQCCPL